MEDDLRRTGDGVPEAHAKSRQQEEAECGTTFRRKECDIVDSLDGRCAATHRSPKILPRSSRQNLLYDVASDVGQPVIAAGVAVGEAFVIEAQEVQHGGVQVVGVDGSFGGQDAVFV